MTAKGFWFGSVTPATLVPAALTQGNEWPREIRLWGEQSVCFITLKSIRGIVSAPLFKLSVKTANARHPSGPELLRPGTLCSPRPCKLMVWCCFLLNFSGLAVSQ